MTILEGNALLAVMICAIAAAAYWRVKIKRDLTWAEVQVLLVACVLRPAHMLRVALRRKDRQDRR